MPKEENSDKWEKAKKWSEDKKEAYAESLFEGENKGFSFKHCL